MPNPAELTAEADRLVDFARAAAHPRGFGWLDEQGRLADRPVELWISCRMTHVFALQSLRTSGFEQETCRDVARHGVDSLLGPLRDADHDGWFAAIGGGSGGGTGDGSGGQTSTAKEAYGHAFVVLAGASAAAAGVPGGEGLLVDALGVLDRRFWDERQRMPVESWDRAWLEAEPYRGANATMHLVEAMLAAHHVTGERELLDRALACTERVVHRVARESGWRLPEHFDERWRPLPDFNRDEPAHPFRPYGVTVGHLLEWSRLTLQLGLALGDDAPAWVGPDARSLFDRAVADGWQEGDEPGFCYTTDFDGAPVVTARMHWVLAEAVGAAHVLGEVTGSASYAGWRDRWLDLAWARWRDAGSPGGSWWHELDEANRPARTVWQGKPDVYHAWQAVLAPTLPLAPSVVAAVVAAGEPGGQSQ